MNVAILMGGTSTEREISISTGMAVAKACEQLNYEVDSVMLNDSIESVLPRLRNMDIVFNALHGGEGENGDIQRCLDEENIVYTGSGPEASYLCMNKHLSKGVVREAEFDTPDWYLINPSDDIPKNLIFPLVVKPNDQGSTVGLSIVHNEDELIPAIDRASVHSDKILLETFIPGREITVAIVGKDVFPIVEIVPSHELYDYECKYTTGMSRYECPAKIPEALTNQIQNDALRMYEALNCSGYGRVDFRLDDNGRYWFLEMNTLPGMTDTSLVPKAYQAGGGTFSELINKIITEALNG